MDEEVSNAKQSEEFCHHKVKNFVITDDVSHYIVQEWMHIHSCFQKKESHSHKMTSYLGGL